MAKKRTAKTDDRVLDVLVRMEYFDDVTRRLRLPASCTLERLHLAMQTLFGFFNYHAHQFLAPRGHVYMPRDPEEMVAHLGCAIEKAHDTFETTVGSLLRKKGDKFLYDYDFGDGWRFYLSWEGARPASETEHADRIVCLDGAKSGPPEDCGGPPGFDNLKAVLKKKRRTRDDKELLAWLEEMQPGYDPDHFDRDAVNRALEKI